MKLDVKYTLLSCGTAPCSQADIDRRFRGVVLPQLYRLYNECIGSVTQQASLKLR